MARFYGSIQGSRGEATRLGTAKSGLRGHIRGWAIGARVNCFVDDDGEDAVSISITSGSNGDINETWLGTWVRTERGIEQKVTP